MRARLGTMPRPSRDARARRTRREARRAEQPVAERHGLGEVGVLHLLDEVGERELHCILGFFGAASAGCADECIGRLGASLAAETKVEKRNEHDAAAFDACARIELTQALQRKRRFRHVK